MFKYRFLISALVVACCAIPASAALTTYTTLPSFTAATINQTFQNVVFPTGSQGTSYTDLLTQVAFSDGNGLTGIAPPTGWPAGTALQATPCPGSFACGGGSGTLTIVLPSTVTSFAMYFGNLDFTSPDVAISNTGGQTFVGSGFAQGNVQTPVFFGFVTDTPISSFTITVENHADQLTLENVQVGAAAPQTPEAATFLLIGSGLFMLRYARRWMPRVA